MKRNSCSHDNTNLSCAKIVNKRLACNSVYVFLTTLCVRKNENCKVHSKSCVTKVLHGQKSNLNFGRLETIGLQWVIRKNNGQGSPTRRNHKNHKIKLKKAQSISSWLLEGYSLNFCFPTFYKAIENNRWLLLSFAIFCYLLLSLAILCYKNVTLFRQGNSSVTFWELKNI